MLTAGWGMLPRPKRFELAKVLTIYLGHSKNVRNGVANPVPLVEYKDLPDKIQLRRYSLKTQAQFCKES